MMEVVVHAKGVREVVAALESIDKRHVTELRNKMKGTAEATASIIRKQVETIPAPLSGMTRQSANGRTLYWGGVETKVSFQPKNKRRGVSSLLAIKVIAPKRAPGFIVAEKAGARGHSGESGTGQATHLIAVMTDTFGRLHGRGKGQQRLISWQFFWRQRDLLQKAAIMVLQEFEKKITREMSA